MKNLHIPLTLLIALGLAGCNFSSHPGESMTPDASLKGDEYYKKHPIFTPVIQKTGSVTKFLTPDGRETLIRYDSKKLVDIDKRSHDGFKIASVASQAELEETEQIINTAVVGAFQEGFYADLQPNIETPVGEAIINRSEIAKPVEVEVANDGLLEKMYEVPVVYNDKVAAIARVGEYKGETGYSPISYAVPNSDPSTMPGDGIVPVYSLDTAKSELSSDSTRGYQTLSLTAGSTQFKRIYMKTEPRISDKGSVILFGSDSASYVMNAWGDIFKADGSYSVSSTGRKMPSTHRVKLTQIN